jgi:hypothetical protein
MKKALIIGCNYIGTQNQLQGCINDAVNLQTYLKYRYPSCQFQILRDDIKSSIPTSKNIKSGLSWLANVKKGSIIGLFYSGHGTQTIDVNGDETDKEDEGIVPYDLNMISDDYLNNIFLPTIPNQCTLYCMFDSCMSGTILDLPCNMKYSGGKLIQFTGTKLSKTITPNIYCLSGCLDGNYSSDVYALNSKTGKMQYQGAMTSSLLSILYKGNTTQYRTLLTQLTKVLVKYGQVPTISTNKPTNFLNVITL